MKIKQNTAVVASGEKCCVELNTDVHKTWFWNAFKGLIIL